MNKLGWKRLLAFVLVAVCGTVFLAGCLLHRRRRADLAAAVNVGDQPDKILFDKAINEIRHSRYDIGRLTLQTLINTYPDSEFLAKAKLAIANSYYDQGGVTGLTQAEAEYKDFITFFPTAPEAPEAQYRIGMSHFHMMAKADRDQTEARLAEAELKEFLMKYPSSPLTIRVKARLREAQEVLAQGEYETASFYLMRGSYRAARGRFQDVVEKYPNFSMGDEALYGLGQSLERLKTPQEAVPYYSRLISDFPLSAHVPEAKERLVAMKQPVPVPTKATLARARADAVRLHEKSLFQKMRGTMSSTPDTSATLRGPVHLQPNPVEAAKAALPPLPPANAAIVAEPVNDTALESGQPAESATGAESGPKKEAASAKEDKSKEFGNKSSIFKVEDKGSRLHVLKKIVRKDTGSTAKETTTKAGEKSATAEPEKKKGRFHVLKNIVKKESPEEKESGKGSAGKETGAKAKEANKPSGEKSATAEPEKKKGRFHVLKKVVRKGEKPKTQEKDTSSASKETGAKAKEAETNKGSGEQSTAAAPEKKKGRFHIVKKIIRKDKKSQEDDTSSTGKESSTKAKEADKDSGAHDQ